MRNNYSSGDYMENFLTLSERLSVIKERCEKATKGPWLLGYWTIHDSDREAQKRREPYWTLMGGIYETIVKGPIGRKSLDTEYVVQGNGHDSNDLYARAEDLEFICHSRTDIPKLIEVIEVLSDELIETRQRIGILSQCTCLEDRCFRCHADDEIEEALEQATQIMGDGK